MPLIVYDTELIHEIAHRAWSVLQLDPEDPERPPLTYSHVMQFFRAVHLGQIVALGYDHYGRFDVKVPEWFATPGPEHVMPTPVPIVDVAHEIEQAIGLCIAQSRDLTFLPIELERVGWSIIRYVYRIASADFLVEDVETVDETDVVDAEVVDELETA